MPPRPSSWQDVILTDPNRAVRVNRPGGLGAWRSVVPSRPASGGRGGGGGGQGQPNDLERQIAEKALAERDGFNPFNAGGRLLMGALDVLDTPGAFVRSAIKEAADSQRVGGSASLDEFVQQGFDNISGSELLFPEGLPDDASGGERLAASGAGFLIDIATDPLTFVGGSMAKPGAEAGQQAARRFLTPQVKNKLGEAAVEAAERSGTQYATRAAREEAVQQLGSEAAAEAAQKAAKFRDNRMLSPLEREAIGATPGTYVKVPLSQRSKTVARKVEQIAGDRAVRAENGRLLVRATSRELPAIYPRVRKVLTQNRFADAVASKMTRYPELREKMLYGTADEAAAAIQTLSKTNAADLQENLIQSQWGEGWNDVAARLKKAGVSGEDARYALGGDEGALAQVRARAAANNDDSLVDDLVSFRDRIVDDANSIDPELPWLNKVDDFTTRTASDEMIALRGGFGDGAARFKADPKRRYGPKSEGYEVDELFGQKLLPKSEAGGRSVDRQIDDILAANNATGWFEKDLFKSMPAYLRRMSRRYREEWLSKQLRDLGIASPALVRDLTEAGVRQGRIKAATTKMMIRAQMRAVRQAEDARLADQVARDAQKGVTTARRLRTRARKGAADAAREARTNQGMIDVLDVDAVREQEAEMVAEAATIGGKRQEILDSIDAGADDVFRLDHMQVEASHRLNMESYNATRVVTTLEDKVSQQYVELGDLYERVRLLGGATDYRKARKKLDEMIARLDDDLEKVAANPGRYAADKLDRMVAEEQRLTALTTDTDAFKAWADKQNNLTRGTSREYMAGRAAKELQQVEADIVRVMGEIGESEAALYQYKTLAEVPTDGLDAQLADVEEKLRQAVNEYDTMRSIGAKNRVETLSNLRAGILHDKGVIERARGRVSEEVERIPDLRATLDELRNQEALGNKIIHTVFPDVPAEVNGARIVDYFTQRLNDMQDEIAATQNTILGAYADRDTLRVELSGIRGEKREAERRLSKLQREGTQRDQELAEEQLNYLTKADELSTRANEIEDEIGDLKDQIDTYGPAALGAVGDDPTWAERLAEQTVAAFEAKADRAAARAVAAEADSRVARRTADFWTGIAQREWTKEQETALQWSLDDSMRQLGAVSQTQYDWLVDTLSRATVMQGPQGIRGGLRAYDKVLNLWKAYALSTPGTVLRNLFGATWNNYLSDIGIQTADYDKVMKWGLLGQQGRRRGALSAEDAEIMQRIQDAGLFTGSATSLEIARTLGQANYNPLSIDNKAIRMGRRGQERVENLARGAMAFRVLKNGGTMDDAIDQVARFHFNYDDLSALERSGFRRVVPFYTWSRKNFPLMFEQLMTNPKKFVRFYQVRNNIEANSPEESIVPGYFGENMSIRMPFSFNGSRIYQFPDLPFMALNDVTDISSAGSMASPFVKVPLEYAFGRQLYKSLPLKDEWEQVPAAFRIVPGSMDLLGTMGRARRGANGQWYMKQKDMYVLESFLPLYGRGRRLFPTEEKYDDRVLTSWASIMFGTGMRTNTPQDRRNAAFERVDRELERIESYDELGYFDDGTKMPRPGQTINAAYQALGVERQ